MSVTIHNMDQNGPEWDQIRSGKPTASQFHKLVTPAKLEASKQVDDYALEIAAERWAGGPIETWEGNQWTERGHELAPEARAYYEMRKLVEVEQVGFIENEELQAGCSPDGLIDSDGMLEMKNLGAKEHIRTLYQDECPAKYRPQLQGQLLIAERKWVDIVFYHPQLPKKIIRVLPDQKIQDLLVKQLKILHGLVNHYTDIIERAA